MSKTYNHITPSNKPANGIISFKGGQPLVTFTIGEQDRYLLGSTIRVNGTFKCKKDDDAVITGDDDVSLDSRLGILSVIDMITLSTKRSNRTLEQIRHYGRFMASFLPVTSGANEFIAPYSGSFGATLNQNQSRLQLFQSTTDGVAFSLPLMCGLFSGQNPIPLSMNWGLGGITIQINLAPDINVFKNGNAASNTQYYYELSDVYLSCELAIPPPMQLNQLLSQSSGQFEYNSISTYYDTITASYSTINFNLGLSRVLSLWVNFIQTTNVNSSKHNGFTMFPLRNQGGEVAPITRVNFLRGGIKFPLNYELDGDPEEKLINPQLLRTYIDSISTFTKVNRTCVNVNNTNNTRTNGEVDLEQYNIFEGGPLYGIGVPYDAISDLGANFSAQQLGIVIESTLTSDNPHGAYIFCHAKNVLTYGPNGVNIQV